MKRILKWILGIGVVAFGALAVTWVMHAPPKDARGTWQTEGYGLAVDVGAAMIDVYQVSNVHCHPDQQIPGHMWLVDYLEGVQFARDGERLKIAVAGTLNPIYATRTEALPALCDTTPPNNAQTTFDVMWDVMDTHYAHFDTHGVDWAARKALRPDGPLDAAALFAVFRQALDGLDDGHTFVAAGDDAWSPALPAPWHDDRYVVRDATLAAVPDLSESTEVGLQIGWAAPGIGYVLMAHMGPDAGFGQRQADVATEAFAQVADYFKDADGVILDVRYNPGGSDDVSLAYAGYFTDQPVSAFTKTTRTETGYTAPYTATIPPQATQITAPVVVLTSKFTGSAAEIFTMAMRELPQVTTMGEPTSGGLSDVLTFTLPNDWTLGLSHQIYKSMADEDFERVGVPPDIALPVDVAAAQNGVDTILQAAIAHLQNEP